MGGFALPSENAFKWCFGLGALAAFIGVAIAGLVPRRNDTAGAEVSAAAAPVRR